MKTNTQRIFSAKHNAASHSRKTGIILRALALAALLLSSGLVQKSAAQELKFLTWNICGIRCAGAGHLYDIAQFNRVITDPKVNPDALSLQEVTLDEALRIAYAMGYHNRTDILAHLQFVSCKQYPNKNLDPNYLAYYGLRASDFGGDGSNLGGYLSDFGNAIITARRFPIRERGRWTPASQDPAQANAPRSERNRLAVASIEISTNQFVNLCSMHTPNAISQASYARNQANEIRQIAKGTYGNYRYVLLGDFNMQRPSNPNDMNHAYNVLRAGFNDAWYEWKKNNPGMQDYLGMTISTAHPVMRYDYIFLDNRRPTDVLYARALNPDYMQPGEYSLNFTTALYRMGSDHFPVFARVNFK
jgi:endonuclease/exonuclease/phosphatase family metal-dependent hydrolase